MSEGILIIQYDNSKMKEWNTFVSNSKNPLFMFDRNYMDYHNDRFVDSSFMFYESDRLVALLPANIKGDILFSHGGLTYGGLILDDKIKQHTVNDCFEILIDTLKGKGIKHLIYKPTPHIYHEQPCEEDLYSLYRYGAKLSEVSASTVINLMDPLKMPKGRKAQISRAKREGVIIKKLADCCGFKSFIELENEVLQKRHNVHAVHTADELFLLYERFPNNISLYGALQQGNLIAGTIIYEYGQVIHTQYMAANELARKIGALDLVVNTVIEEYRERKKWLDFGISTEGDGRYLNEGLISQKEGFGGRTNVYQLWEMSIM